MDLVVSRRSLEHVLTLLHSCACLQLMATAINRLKRHRAAVFSEWRKRAAWTAHRRRVLGRYLAQRQQRTLVAAFRAWRGRLRQKVAARQGLERRIGELVTMAFYGWRHRLLRHKARALQSATQHKRLARWHSCRSVPWFAEDPLSSVARKQSCHITAANPAADGGVLCHVCTCTLHPDTLSIEECIHLPVQFAPLLAALQPGGSPEEGETDACRAAVLCQPSDLSLARLAGLCEPAKDRKSPQRKASGVEQQPDQNP